MSNVIPLPTARAGTTRLDLLLRVGSVQHGQVATLYAEGRARLQRAIFDAPKVKHQLSFLKTLRDDNVELILDTQVAELAAPARYHGHPSGAPWATGELEYQINLMTSDANCWSI